MRLEGTGAAGNASGGGEDQAEGSEREEGNAAEPIHPPGGRVIGRHGRRPLSSASSVDDALMHAPGTRVIGRHGRSTLSSTSSLDDVAIHAPGTRRIGRHSDPPLPTSMQPAAQGAAGPAPATTPIHAPGTRRIGRHSSAPTAPPLAASSPDPSVASALAMASSSPSPHPVPLRPASEAPRRPVSIVVGDSPLKPGVTKVSEWLCAVDAVQRRLCWTMRGGVFVCVGFV